MTYSKKYPREVEGSNYPTWVEIVLSDKEEKQIEEQCRKENIELMNLCIDEAKNIVTGRGLKDYQSNMISLAIELFRKKASHLVYHKERKCKEKFDKIFMKQ